MTTSASLERTPRTMAINARDNPSHESRVQIPCGPYRILVADDDMLVAMGMASSLKDLGHNVVAVVADGEAAVRAAREHKPDLAMLDIRMPRLDGIDAAAAIATELGIPSLIVSAYSDPEHIKRMHARPEVSGVFGYLLKPVQAEELRVAISVCAQLAAVDEFRRNRIDQLETNLSNRRIVEQAKWTLVEKHRLSEAQAHEKLQRAARDRRQALIDVAQGVINSGQLP